jgi:hypothetical protein
MGRIRMTCINNPLRQRMLQSAAVTDLGVELGYVLSESNYLFPSYLHNQCNLR